MRKRQSFIFSLLLMSQKFKCLKKKIDRGKYMAKEPYGNINLDLIREMSEAHGISGCEKEVSRVMKKYMGTNM